MTPVTLPQMLIMVSILRSFKGGGGVFTLVWALQQENTAKHAENH